MAELKNKDEKFWAFLILLLSFTYDSKKSAEKEDEKMTHDIPHEQSLILNFFNGEVYFVFEDQEEAESFLDYIKGYDTNFDTKDDPFRRQAEMKSAAWMYSNTSHRLQMEWGDSEEYFKERFLMKPVSYSIVRKDAETETRFRKLFETFKGLVTGEEK